MIRFNKEGLKAEDIFIKLAEKKYKFVKKSTLYQDRHQHFDVMVKFNNHPLANMERIEIKSLKAFSKGTSKRSDWIFVEFKNVNGHAGWLYGHADKMAFEMPDHFLLVDRKDLVKLSESKVNRKIFVKKPQDAKYRVYRRKDRRRDLVPQDPRAEGV